MSGTLHYSLGTDIVSHLARHPQGSAARHLARVGVSRVGISIIVVCEIRFGLAKQGGHRLRQHLDLILGKLPSLPLEPPVETRYAQVRHGLEQAGTPIGPNDLLIAARALALDLTLVTDNTREFSRVPGLRLENWLV